MSAPTPLAELAEAVAEGLSRPRHAWEAVAIAVALLVALAGARVFAALAGRRRAPNAPRLLFPFLALLALGVAEAVLRAWHVLSSAADARLLRLAASLVAALLVARVLFALLRRVLHNAAVVSRLERVIVLAVLAVVGLYATGVLGDAIAWLASMRIPLGSATEVSVWSLLVGSATVVVALLAAMWLGSLIEERLGSETSLEPNLRTVLVRAARALLLVLAVLLALALSGIDLTVLSVFGGALGVGLGLGLQRIASNYVSGFILLLDRSLRIGDVISVDRYFGQVTQISTRYTVLRASDATEAIVPNEMLVSLPVVNLTLGDRRVLLSASIPVGPTTDLALAMRLMREAAAAQARVLAEPAPVALHKEILGGNIVLEVFFSISDPENGRQNVQSDVAVAMIGLLRQHGIPVAAPRAVALAPEAAPQ